MITENETLTIELCPLCKNPHQFNVEVERAISMAYLSFNTPKQKTRFFTRLFTCPKTGNDFQARFSLTESTNSTIESVNITGISDEETIDDKET